MPVSSARLMVNIALPSGLELTRREPVLNALQKAGDEFMEKLGIQRFVTCPAALLESEMALLASMKRPATVEPGHPDYKSVETFFFWLIIPQLAHPILSAYSTTT